MPLTAESLISQATEQTGLTDFDLPDSPSPTSTLTDSVPPDSTSPSRTPPDTPPPASPKSTQAHAPWREALDILLRSATAESHLNPTGEFMLEMQLVSYLRNRLLVLDWARRHPDILAAPVVSPVFITGHGRTGTTLLSYLLDQDPATRSLMGWETANPLPPPRAETFANDPRIQAMAQNQEYLSQARPEMKTIHWEAPDGPTECVTLLAQAARSMLYETLWNLPSYGEWYPSRPQHDAYSYHKIALQVLQSEAPGRWMLKSPHHSIALPEVFAAYPDARIILTHRDPAISFASVLNLITTFTGYGSDHDWSSYIRTRWLEVWQMIIRRLEEAQTAQPDRFLNILYADMMENPMRTAEQIYEWLDWKMTDETRQAMQIWLDENPQGKHGRHSYNLTDFGYTPEDATSLFGDYTTAHSIPPEGC